MQEEVIFAGFGGQGILFAGQLLAHAAMCEGKHVTWFPSYGPEMRGGTANCTVVVSDDPIGSPVVLRPSVAVVFNQPSMLKYCDLVKPGGLLVINTSLVTATTEREDIVVCSIAATDIANDLGETRMTNMILSGAMLALRPMIPVQRLSETLRIKLPQRRHHLLEANIAAIEKGAALARAELAAVT